VGPFSYQWLFDGESLPGETSENLNLSQIRFDQAGDYQVAVLNTTGSASSEPAILEVVIAALDSDMDGMPDDYETANGLDPGFDDTKLDLDGDGFSNEEEFLAGTDPDDAASFLQILEIEDTGDIVIRFNAVENRSYTVEYRDEAHTGDWQSLAEVPAISAGSTAIRPVSVTNTKPIPTGSRYYRVVTPGQ
jgi:hypothetical protein